MLLSFHQVQHMRRNLDQSEAAIIQVFEEKQRVWERQMDELRQNYASRLQQVTSLQTFMQNNVKVHLHFVFFTPNKIDGKFIKEILCQISKTTEIALFENVLG